MQQQPRLPLWFLVVNWALILAAFALGAVLGGNRSHLPDPQRAALEIVYHEVMQSHIEPPDGHAWLEKALQQMVRDLDPYSRYVPPTAAAAYDEDSTGTYEGIGIGILRVTDAIVFGCPIEGGPAEQAGLLPGDVLLAIDGVAIDSAELRGRAVDMVRGPAGTEVRLTVDRDGTRLEKNVRRGDVQSPCVKWAHFVDPERGLGYLHLTDFHPTAATQVLEAIDRLQAERPLSGLILDLRFDGGGSLDACLDIARAFLPSGVIATQSRRGGEIVETYHAESEKCRFPELPLVVLVNEFSASASEVLSGALQDHERAAIVGVRTHGKAYVNTVYTWKNHDFRLKLTTGTYRTPKGRNIERSYRTDGQAADAERGGIPPDDVVELTKEQRAAVQVVLAQREPPAKYAAAYAAAAARHGVEVPMPPAPASDAQLARAVDVLAARVAAAPTGTPR